MPFDRQVAIKVVAAPATIDVFAISPDNRHINYGGARAEADIWILERT